MAQVPFDLQGHRGCRGLMPENSWPAFEKALELGVTTLEMDVVISKDGQVVVSHEPYFMASYCLKPDGSPIEKGEKINLHTLTYGEIKKYDTGSKGNPDFPKQKRIETHKPLLSKVLAKAEAYCRTHGRPAVNYNIEIKSEASEYGISQPRPAEFSELVYRVIKGQVPLERVTLQSFDFEVLRYWQKQVQVGKYGKVKLAALVSNLKGIETNLESLGFTPAIYSSYYKLLSADKVKRLHEKGMLVIPWTVNDIDAMKEVKAMGVDGLITDYPDRYLKTFP
ncbi:glycerophosphodiester phosphodiesterase family protein [Salmonirosea aquatica]